MKLYNLVKQENLEEIEKIKNCEIISKENSQIEIIQSTVRENYARGGKTNVRIKYIFIKRDDEFKLSSLGSISEKEYQNYLNQKQKIN